MTSHDWDARIRLKRSVENARATCMNPSRSCDLVFVVHILFCWATSLDYKSRTIIARLHPYLLTLTFPSFSLRRSSFFLFYHLRKNILSSNTKEHHHNINRFIASISSLHTLDFGAQDLDDFTCKFRVMMQNLHDSLRSLKLSHSGAVNHSGPIDFVPGRLN